MPPKKIEVYKVMVANFIAEKGRLPAEVETAELCGVSRDVARRVLALFGEDMAEVKKGMIEEIRELIGERLRERLDNKDERVSDSNLVALARFIMPAKQEVKQEGNVEYTIKIVEPDADNSSGA